jgi:dihydroorotase
MAELLLRGGLVVTPAGVVTADVLVSGDRVAEVGQGLSRAGATVIDCSGCWVGPGLVDVHAHFREPGQEWKEDIESGSRAAAAGGFAAVVFPAGCITAGRAGLKLAHLDELWAAGVRLFTDDGACIADAGLLRRAMEYLRDVGGVVAQHAEDSGLARNGHLHEGSVSATLGMVGIPSAAEEVIVGRDLAIARLTGAPYHVQHVSSGGTVALIRAAKREGIAVTAEVAPHHLAFDHGEVMTTDPAFKMYPPLREPSDRTALRDALRDGTIDMVATDHAPHAPHETEVPFEEAPRGVISLETAVGAVLTSVGLGVAELFDRLSVAPARLAGLDGHGRLIEAGILANISVIDPHAEWVVGRFVSRSSNSPFAGRSLTGRPRHVLLRGRFTLLDGEVQG